MGNSVEYISYILCTFSDTLRDARRAGALLLLFFQKGGKGGGGNFSSQYHMEFHGWQDLVQGCQTYGPWAKTDPLRGWIRPAGWFCKVKTSLFAWEVYPVILQLLVTRFKLLQTLTQLLICFSHVKISRFLHISFCMFTPVWTFKQVCTNVQKYNYCW